MGGEMTHCTPAVRFPDVGKKKVFTSFIREPVERNVYWKLYCLSTTKGIYWEMSELCFNQKLWYWKFAVKINIEILHTFLKQEGQSPCMS